MVSRADDGVVVERIGVRSVVDLVNVQRAVRARHRTVVLSDGAEVAVPFEDSRSERSPFLSA